MRLRTYITLLGLAVLLTACGTSVKSSWTNFRAYYNTYYNAKKNFREGYRKVSQQKLNLNPEQPIRIHPQPVKAGDEEFTKAIDKGATILRKFPDSKWVDDALALIGKSYFFKEEYFSADQKFQELYRTTEDPEMRHRAVIWRGRVFLETGLFAQGINYIKGELEDSGSDWKPASKAEAFALMAEFHTQLEQPRQAITYLEQCLPNLEGRLLQARGYFLYGQLLEEQGMLDQAFEAYRRVPGLHPPYELVSLAERKEAEVSRESGNLERALDIYTDMSRDDKNFDIRPDLYYEIARTQQARGNYGEAERIYNRVLHQSINPPSRETAAKAYYGLAEVFRYHYKNFAEAAAYYDSASSQNADPDKVPESFNAGGLAQSFGEYARLKSRSHRLDSLLWLGSLPPARFDSVLQRIRERKRREMQRQLRERQQQSNTLVNITGNGGGATADESSDSGFLNYRNPRQLADARRQFQAYWGNRPLVDDWRRVEAVRQFRQNGGDTAAATGAREQVAREEEGGREVEIDLSEIPFTDEAKQKTKKDLARVRYELGNVFFLSLNMPDSAQVYYRSVIERFPHSSYAPQAMYSLVELSLINNKPDTAKQWAQTLMDQYPQTVYAMRAADRMKLKKGGDQQNGMSIDSTRFEYNKRLDSLMSFLAARSARKWQQFAGESPWPDMAGRAMLKAARHYLEASQLEPVGSRPAYSPSRLLMALRDTAGTSRSSAPVCPGTWWPAARHTALQLNEQYPDYAVYFSLGDAQADSLVTCRDLELATLRPIGDADPTQPGFRAYMQLADSLQDFRRLRTAEFKREFALEHRSMEGGARLLFQAAEDYMQMAKQDTAFRRREQALYEARRTFSARQTELQALQDSAAALLRADSLSDARRKYWSSMADSTLETPDFAALFPYRGAYWDSTRSVLANLQQYFPEFGNRDQVRRLAETLKIPSAIQQQEESDRQRFEPEPALPEKPFYTCGELGVSPEVVGGMKNFMSKVDFPERVKNMHISGELTYRMMIDKEGKPIQWDRISETGRLDLEGPLEQAFKDSLRFRPLTNNGRPVNVQCEVTFPIGF